MDSPGNISRTLPRSSHDHVRQACNRRRRRDAGDRHGLRANDLAGAAGPGPADAIAERASPASFAADRGATSRSSASTPTGTACSRARKRLADPMVRDAWSKLDPRNAGRVSRADFDKYGTSQPASNQAPNFNSGGPARSLRRRRSSDDLKGARRRRQSPTARSGARVEQARVPREPRELRALGVVDAELRRAHRRVRDQALHLQHFLHARPVVADRRAPA